MSSSGVIRMNGLDGAPHMAFESSRRRIEPADVAFANANKHRLGWQTMAKMRGVNMHDLRRACDFAYAQAATPPEAVPAAKPGSKAAPSEARRRMIDPVRVLRAIHDGAASRQDLAEILGCTAKGAGAVVEDLKARGFLAGHSRSFTGWLVTNAGLAVLRTGRMP